MQGQFGPEFRAELADLMRWRRDVRHFRTDPVEAAVLDRCLQAFAMAPSVGLSEPWRLLRVESAAARAAVTQNFEATNAEALATYDADKAGLGAASMPETRAYSVVGAITLFWLMLRAEGLGLGWVSILDPDRLARDLAAPESWRFIGYLCVGRPEEDSDTPELARIGWEARAPELIMESR